MGCLEINLSPLQAYHVLFILEPSLESQNFVAFISKPGRLPRGGCETILVALSGSFCLQFLKDLLMYVHEYKISGRVCMSQHRQVIPAKDLHVHVLCHPELSYNSICCHGYFFIVLIYFMCKGEITT